MFSPLQLAGMPPSQNIINPAQEWGVGDIVDKDTLRPEVQKFCGHFPIYRLKPFIPPDSVSVAEGDEDDTLTGKSVKYIYTWIFENRFSVYYLAIYNNKTSFKGRLKAFI